MADAKGAYIGGVPVQFKDAAARAMISDEYNSAETYAKGNLCIYNGKIYEAIKETTGTWDATAWEETTLAKVNGKLNGDIASLTEKCKNWGNSYTVEEGFTASSDGYLNVYVNPSTEDGSYIILSIGGRYLTGNNSNNGHGYSVIATCKRGDRVTILEGNNCAQSTWYYTEI